MKMTQGQFSFLPDLSDDDIHLQAQYAIDRGWGVSVEWTDDPHLRNTFWEMWGHPIFDNPDAAAVVYEVNQCRKLHGGTYIPVIAFDASPGWGVDPHALYREPPGRGVRLPPGPAGGRGPRGPLHDRKLCDA
nr:ribulose bisphosphate carboxylase small subunit [Paracoccus saliphilus]